ncbi:hypothetical protein K439DRAFT_1663840 [Ramaria rubella]|nr:hypothetical protein K439DRAFT_1663840 [Ramaria rubella]
MVCAMVSRHQEHSTSSEVSSMLHNLRGEAFRRQRNILGVRARAPSPLAHGPTLPLLFLHEDQEGTQGNFSVTYPAAKTAGPPPPPSWVPSAASLPTSISSQWRSDALSLILRYAPSPSPALALHVSSNIPHLFQLCLHYLLFKLGGIPPKLFPLLPRHILREYVRYAVVHVSDLPGEDLEALWAVDNAGSADGEIIIAGPHASSVLPRLTGSPNAVLSDWDVSDAVEQELPPALHTFIVLSTFFSSSLLSLLPPTLTHLALLGIQRIPVHTLPIQLPHIIVLDLSFNPWIAASSSKIIRIEWRKWTKFEVLGVRGCELNDEDARALRESVNRGRLMDIRVVLD